MGHRKVMRVPMDFDAPLNETWAGYVIPDEIRPPACADCDRSGYSPTARWLHDTFYDHHVASICGGWGDKLVQTDVDVLVEAGRLRRWDRDSREWVTVPRTADEVNAAQHGRLWSDDLHSHDGINCWVLVKSRCERLGASPYCPTCGGSGMIGTPEAIDAYENWVGTEPPVGNGWQMWETTTEGSPQTPVFATADELADYCAEHCTPFADIRWTARQWLDSFTSGTTDVDTLLVIQDGERVAP